MIDLATVLGLDEFHEVIADAAITALHLEVETQLLGVEQGDREVCG